MYTSFVKMALRGKYTLSESLFYAHSSSFTLDVARKTPV